MTRPHQTFPLQMFLTQEPSQLLSGGLRGVVFFTIAVLVVTYISVYIHRERERVQVCGLSTGKRNIFKNLKNDHWFQGNKRHPSSKIKEFSTILYNRVPKTGSMSFYHTLLAFGRKNGSANATWKDIGTFGAFNTNYLSTNKIECLKRQLDNPSWLTSGHFHFVDLQGDQYVNALKLNLVRNPLDHFESRWFWNIKLLRDYLGSHFESVTYEECNSCHLKPGREIACNMIMSLSLCQGTIVDYFCGYAITCQTGSFDDKLEQALRNLRTFDFVAVLEDMDLSLQVLSKMIGQNLTSFQLNSNASKSKGNSTFKIEPMPSCMKYEMYLYEHIRNKLRRTAAMLL